MSIKDLFSRVKEHISPSPKYYAIKHSADGGVISNALVSVLGKWSFLGWWNIGDISKIMTRYHTKNIPFAVKNFPSSDKAFRAISNYHLLKQAKIPTWTTYRLLQKENENLPFGILMTLGSSKDRLCFSPHNLSNDRQQIKEYKLLEQVTNLQDFFQQAFDILSKAQQYNIRLAWDTYMLILKNQSELELLVWDLDFIKEAKDSMPEEVFENNLYDFLWMLVELEFHIWASWIDDFTTFLEKEKGIDSKDLSQEVKKERRPWARSCD